MMKILIEPSEAWEAFKRELSANPDTPMVKLGENESRKTEVYIADTLGTGTPEVLVSVENEWVFYETVDTPEECENLINLIFEDYLDIHEFEEIEEHFKDSFLFDEEDAIYERETEIDDALYDFLTVIYEGEDFPFSTNEIEDIKDHFISHLYSLKKIDIRRPMYLRSEESQTSIFKEYPYQYLE